MSNTIAAKILPTLACSSEEKPSVPLVAFSGFQMEHHMDRTQRTKTPMRQRPSAISHDQHAPPKDAPALAAQVITQAPVEKLHAARGQ